MSAPSCRPQPRVRHHDFAANAVLELDFGPGKAAFASDRENPAMSKPRVDDPRTGLQLQVFLRIRVVVAKRALPSGLSRALAAPVPLEPWSSLARPAVPRRNRATRVTEASSRKPGTPRGSPPPHTPTA